MKYETQIFFGAIRQNKSTVLILLGTSLIIYTMH